MSTEPELADLFELAVLRRVRANANSVGDTSKFVDARIAELEAGG